MTTDWKPARDLEALADKHHLPAYVRAVAAAGADMIRQLDEELSLRNDIITRLRAGEAPPGDAYALAAWRAGYHAELRGLQRTNQDQSPS